MRIRILAAIALLITLTANSAHKIEAVIGEVEGAYNYWFAQPDSLDQSDERKPVVVFLHGASLCGNDLNRVRRYGTIDAIDRGRNIDAYVIAPQNPGGAWNPEKIIKIVDHTLQNHNADPDRVYVIGMSLGGYGTIDLAADYPDRIAAAMAFCGGGTSKNLGDLNLLPLWIIHGTGDRAVGVGESDKVVSAMRVADHTTPRLIYDRIPGMNHSQPARFFYMPQTYQWLFSHSLSDEDRPVTPRFDIMGHTHHAYSGLTHNVNRSKAKASAKKKNKSKSSAKSKNSSKKKRSKKKSKK